MAGVAHEQEIGRPALEIADVVATGGLRDVGIVRGSLRVNMGELAMVQVLDLHQAELWADVAVGLVTPQRGRVSILGNDLDTLDLEVGNWLRGRIGRVFSRGNWLDRLTLMDNILLSARHHSIRHEDELRRQASQLAETFEMPGIPLGTPAAIARLDLQRAACIRAFLGDPLLIILEDPTYASHADLVRPLMMAIRMARHRGAAVLWLSPSVEIFGDRTIPAARRYRMAGNELMEVALH